MADSILATFGLSIVMVGLMLAAIGGDEFRVTYPEQAFKFLGELYAGS